MRVIDRNFTPAAFLDGAEKAFQIIVKAFAAGDRATLRPLLNDETWHAFDLGITEREKAGQSHITDIKAVHAVTIEAADLKDSLASITVKFISDQVNMTLSQSGQVVSGTDAITEIIDLWTLERDLKQPNPTWRLVAARSA
jgi:predicted lipid-binding transport protein (Tim44 family)